MKILVSIKHFGMFAPGDTSHTMVVMFKKEELRKVVK